MDGTDETAEVSTDDDEGGPRWNKHLGPPGHHPTHPIRTMNRAQRTIVLNFAVTVLIVLALNLAVPSAWFWLFWAVVLVLGVFNAINYRRNADEHHEQ